MKKTQENRIEKLSMTWCFLLSGMICVAQIVGNKALLLLLFVIFLMLVLWASDRDFAFPVLLFFLPWSTLLRMELGSFSFFTVGLLIACIYYQFRNHFMVHVYEIVLPAILIAVTLIGKGLQGNLFSMDYIFFFAMLVLFPVVTKNTNNTNFWSICIFFAFGIITAAFSAQYVAKYPNIIQFITVESYQNITRLSGYYGDPNYYSAHITACMSGVLILLNQEENHYKEALLVILLIVLIYCGLLSASKAFVAVSAGVFLIWIPITLKRRGKWNQRIRIIMGIVCAIAFMIASPMFQRLFSIIDDRFAYAANASQLTTGRTDIWKRYIYVLMHDPSLLLFGQGYSDVLLNRKVAHNSLIQLVFQFGLVGFPILLVWMGLFLHEIKPFWMKKIELIQEIPLMLIGVVGPWLGLDILFFDEFFLLPAFMMMGTCHATLSKSQMGGYFQGELFGSV